MSGAPDRGRGTRGALYGMTSPAAMGLVGSAGAWMHDDFVRDVATNYGDLRWASSTLGGSAPTYPTPSPTAATEVGLQQIATAAAANSGGLLSFATAPFFGAPAADCIFAVKVRLSSGVNNYEIWSGFQSGTGRVAVATAVDFIGVRSLAGPNWWGVCKTGAGAGNETTVDLGVATNSTWRVLGYERRGSGVQWFVLDLSDRAVWGRTDVGDPVTTNIPSANAMYPNALGVYTTNATAKTGDIDFFDLGGRCAR